MACFFVAVLGMLYWLATRDGRLILPILFACLGALLLFTLPFSEFLAGFSVSEFDPSFANRYGPELAMVSLIVAVAAIPLSYLVPKWFGTPPQSDSPSPTSTPNPSLKGTHRKRRAP